jgi:hypothetical protein
MSRILQLLPALERLLIRPRRPSSTVLTAAIIGAGIGGLAVALLLAGRRRKTRAVRPDAAPASVSRGPITQAMVAVNPADANMGEPGRNDDERLDEAIQESFPTSDPVSVRIE